MVTFKNEEGMPELTITDVMVDNRNRKAYIKPVAVHNEGMTVMYVIVFVEFGIHNKVYHSVEDAKNDILNGTIDYMLNESF